MSFLVSSASTTIFAWVAILCTSWSIKGVSHWILVKWWASLLVRVSRILCVWTAPKTVSSVKIVQASVFFAIFLTTWTAIDVTNALYLACSELVLIVASIADLASTWLVVSASEKKQTRHFRKIRSCLSQSPTKVRNNIFKTL